ncbi:MAG: Ig-like domain-containing protein [Gemmatimonadota bacterium]
MLRSSVLPPFLRGRLPRSFALAALLGGLTVVGCSDASYITQAPDPQYLDGVAQAPAFTSLRISPKESVLAPGDYSQLRLSDESGNSVDPSQVTWSSESVSVATVSSTGLVQGVSKGEILITARSGDISAQHSVVVVRGSGESDGSDGSDGGDGSDVQITITNSQSILKVGDYSQLQVRDADGNKIDPADVTWSSNSTAVASVSAKGLVQGQGGGETIITGRLGNSTAQHDVFVYGPPAEGDGSDGDGGSDGGDGSDVQITITNSQSVLKVGDYSQLQVRDADGNTIDPADVTWSSASTAIASVSAKGLVRGEGGGETIITGRLGNSTAQHDVFVHGASTGDPDLDHIEISPGSSTLAEGESVQLQAIGRNASGEQVDIQVKWSSDNTGIATVSSGGRVSGVREGTTMIRATSNGVTGRHEVLVRSSAGPAPPSGEWNEPSDFVMTVDERWNSFDDLNWYHGTGMEGSVETKNGKLVWTYPTGMSGGHTPESPVVLHYAHGPYQYQRDEGVTLSANFHGHHSAVNKFRFWSDTNPRSYIGFFGYDDNQLSIGVNTGDWPMGAKRLRWDTPGNYASPTRAQSLVTRGEPHTVESLIYLGTPGNSDGWLKVWLDGVLILDFRNIGIIWADSPKPYLTQIHFAPVWGGMGDVVPQTQTLSVDRTYVSVKP